MTKREIASRIEAEGIDPCDVSLSAVAAYRVAYLEKSGHPKTFMEAVVEMYGVDQGDEWLRLDGEIECRV